MREKRQGVTPAEWRLLECLWERSPRTAREVVERLAADVGWSRSTTLTMLRRMTEKGLLRCGEEKGVHVYSPGMEREQAVVSETESFLKRVYSGSVGLMISSVARTQRLTDAELDELRAILRQAERERGEGRG